jgi:hypothetical protein
MNNRYFMKGAAAGAAIRLLVSVCLLLPVSSCAEGPLWESCRIVLPELPAAWEEILGAAAWQLEWAGRDGGWEKRGLPAGMASTDVPLPEEWAGPVIAWPYWPEKGLLPETMAPAGAIFPWDISGDRLTLGWQAGVDAFFWRELAAAGNQAGSHLPWNFDWPRFRELLANENVPEEIRADPWAADWKAIALKTVQSGFDRRRIVPRKKTEIAVPGRGVTWIGTSPFALPVQAAAGESLCLQAGADVETWVSYQGIVRCTGEAWAFFPYLLPDGEIR